MIPTSPFKPPFAPTLDENAIHHEMLNLRERRLKSKQLKLEQDKLSYVRDVYLFRKELDTAEAERKSEYQDMR